VLPVFSQFCMLMLTVTISKSQACSPTVWYSIVILLPFCLGLLEDSQNTVARSGRSSALEFRWSSSSESFEISTSLCSQEASSLSTALDVVLRFARHALGLACVRAHLSSDCFHRGPRRVCSSVILWRLQKSRNLSSAYALLIASRYYGRAQTSCLNFACCSRYSG
jgi:hypothetical protein